MKDTNPFGGQNALGIYVPMSDIELSLLERLIQARDLKVIVHGWGYIDGPDVTFGDSILHVPIKMDLLAPAEPIPVPYFDLELQTHGGVFLYRETMPCLYDGEPILLGAGSHVEMIWDIAIRRIDPQTLKALMPGAIGLTSRWTDKDTGALTDHGNMKLTGHKRALLETLRSGEKTVNALRTEEIRKARAIARKLGYSNG